MNKNLLVAALATFSLFISGCSKIEWLKDKFKDHEGGPAKNDYLVASVDSVMMVDPDTYVPFLFKKVYEADGKNLKEVIVTFRNFAYGPQVRYYDTLAVKKVSNHQYFISKINDTVVDLILNASGKPVSAIASPTMNVDTKEAFAFAYDNMKLSEIYRPAGGGHAPYIRIDYESGKNNIKAVYFGGIVSGYNDKVAYTYDYAVKATAQYYPDEMRGDYYYFWSFIRYLNVFEELQSENILKYSYLRNTDYPGDVVRFYNQHKFDSKGRLTSFYLGERLTSGSSYQHKGVWHLSW